MNLAGHNDRRDFGDHHIIGSSFPYHGKIPCEYASTKRETDRSPPTASKPSGASSARSMGGKAVALSRSSTITLYAQLGSFNMANKKWLNCAESIIV